MAAYDNSGIEVHPLDNLRRSPDPEQREDTERQTEIVYEDDDFRIPYPRAALLIILCPFVVQLLILIATLIINRDVTVGIIAGLCFTFSSVATAYYVTRALLYDR
ncbi:protein A7 [Aotine betaherpesvirus 1]|uniref:Protein A7 n=1 Tax=Aotine betaherpesvirus 1 TaxID=50290 RepID=G8XU80_9BETA|nr:protein A7 [Aotine betaherpesvirus 1]AEV80817.1 protein A7 [Aotine betaherpesvirus 1]